LQRDDTRIGLAFDVMGRVPYGTSFLDKQAEERSWDINLGWFLEPVVRGDYPFSMRSLARERLPFFKDEQKEKLAGSYNMLGLNYYTSRFSKNIDISPNYSPVLNTDDAYASQEGKKLYTVERTINFFDILILIVHFYSSVIQLTGLTGSPLVLLYVYFDFFYCNMHIGN
jgi:beta-glucosidase/6-phospho-beta-glucosidase/beta-galactosidase